MIKFLFVFLALISASVAHGKSFKTIDSDFCYRYFPIFEKKYQMPNNMLRAISVTESGRYSKSKKKSVAWPWTINVEGKGFYFDSKSSAIAKVKSLLKKGHKSIDVGCMQINLKYHPDAFKSLEQAFEPRYNIEYAAKFLDSKYQRHNSWETSIRHYHNVNKVYSNKYIARVYKNWRIEDKAINVALLGASATNIIIQAKP